MAKRPDEPTFEGALEQLETIVKALEEGELSLDDSLKMFEDGVKLARFCGSKLDDAERRIEVLMKVEEGRIETAPFEPPSGRDGGQGA
ncbi:MAG: exodeoxyribonuclease VII small subunit [Candidatus Polarisedimenticolia bacterium]